MAKYNSAIEVTFNDNDGGVGWRCSPQSVSDFHRYRMIFGHWRARWIFLKQFWIALKWMETYQPPTEPIRLWVFKPEIPE